MQVGLRNLDVVAEDVVEADLERRDAGALPFARFDLRDVLAAVLAEVAQFVEFGVVARADGGAVADVDGRSVGQARRGWARRLRAPDRAARRFRARRAERGFAASRAAFGKPRRLIERFAEREKIARTGAADHDFGEQPFDIEHRARVVCAVRRAGWFRARGRSRRRGALRFRRGRARGAAGAGAADVRPCRSRSDRGRRSRVAPPSEKDRLDEFEIAHRDGVEHHGFGAVEVPRRIEMIERGALRVAQVVEHGAGRRDGAWAIRRARSHRANAGGSARAECGRSNRS